MTENVVRVLQMRLHILERIFQDILTSLPFWHLNRAPQTLKLTWQTSKLHPPMSHQLALLFFTLLVCSFQLLNLKVPYILL